MAIASPSAPSFCCTTRTGSTERRLWQPISVRAGANFPSRGLGRPRIASRLNASSNGELVHELNYSHRRRMGSFPVYVTLPADVVGPNAQSMRRKKAMAQSFWALAAAGVEGVVMEVWWGLVEGEIPGSYNWKGYIEIVELAKRFGLKVRAVMAFHQYGSGPDDPFWLSQRFVSLVEATTVTEILAEMDSIGFHIPSNSLSSEQLLIPLPLWVLQEMYKDPDVAFADRFGRRSMEYISLGCDFLPVLHGRSPIQAYADLMRDFRDTFRPFLGGIITGIQVGLGPAGELRYPSSPTRKLSWGWRSRELGEFQCYDKYMLASLNACAREIGMKQWGNGGPSGTSSLMQNPESTQFFKADGSWMTPYGKFFLGWYSEMLLLHGERICREAKTVFEGYEVNMTGKVAGIHWHYATHSHPSELTSGYYNTRIRDGFLPIVHMFGRYGFTICCSCFEMQDSEEKQINPTSRPESFLNQLLLAARTCDVPFEGENYTTNLDDDKFKQVLKMSKLYADGQENPTFSFNLVRMDKHLFESRRWTSFTHFVRQMSGANMFQASLDFGGGESNFSSRVASAFSGAALAY